MRIRWTESAARDLTQIADYLEDRGSSTIARRVALSITERIEGLTRFPEQGRTGRKSGTRELVLTDLPYVVVYRLGGDSIEILRILHGARIWP
jgi:addiction module RelE/StbE family toxin